MQSANPSLRGARKLSKVTCDISSKLFRADRENRLYVIILIVSPADYDSIKCNGDILGLMHFLAIVAVSYVTKIRGNIMNLGPGRSPAAHNSARRVRGLVVAVLLGVGGLVGCSSTGAVVATTSGAVVLTTTVTGMIPSQEIEQIYYLGVFDPHEQLPRAVYRITVRGQASAMSGMKFGSGWVPAPLIDSLSTSLALDPNSGPQGGVNIATGDATHEAKLDLGRRLVLFGPEGFLEAPRNHRLVMVMGASPDKFFNAIDRVLGTIDTGSPDAGELKQKLFEDLTKLHQEEFQLSRASAGLGEGVNP